MTAPRTGIDPPEALYQRVREAVRAQRSSKLRPNLRNTAALITAAVLASGVVLIASQVVYRNQAMGLHTGVSSAVLLAFVAGALLLVTLASTTTALWRGRTGLGASTATLLAVAISTAPIYALLSLSFPLHTVATTVGSVSISPWGARCLAIAALVGGIVLSCFAFAMRAAAPVATRIRSMALGSAAGAWAGLAVFVFCPSGESFHLLIGHALPVAAFTALGALALPAMLRP
jgi:hypothetical protein